MKLTDKVWKPFLLKTLFNIRMGNGFDKSKMTNNQPEVNFVSRISYNNGVDCIVDKVVGVEPFESGLITVPLGGCYLGSSFIQTKPFYTSQNVAVLQPIYDMSFLVKLFITKTIRIECEYKYQAFCRELNAYLNRTFSVMLPVDINGNPDWAWIEQYMKSLEEGLDDQMNDIMKTADGDNDIIKIFADKVEIDDFKAWLQNNANMDADHQMSLEDTKWKEYLLDDYFDISAGTYYSAKEYEEGTTPYISASNHNNGISKYISLDPDFNGNCIITGKVGCTAFYQNDPFCATSDVNVFKPKFDMSPLVGLFITTLINRSNNYKYDYVRQCRVGDSKKIRVYLPMDDSGNPNWAWIEQYMKSLPYSDKEVGLA